MWLVRPDAYGARVWHVPAALQQPVDETLQDLILRRLSEQEISARTAAERSHGLVAHFTLSRYARGESRKLNAKTAQGIALALDVPMDVVMRAAGLPMTPGPFELPARAHLLTSKERRAVVAVVDALLGAREIPVVEQAKKNGKRPKASR